MISVLARSHLGMVVAVGYKLERRINLSLTTFCPTGYREIHRVRRLDKPALRPALDQDGRYRQGIGSAFF
jgi:hypothetical protein